MTHQYDDQGRPPQTRDEDLANWFTYHPPTSNAVVATYQEIRNSGRDLAELITGKCPDSRERDIAIEKIREAVMWANAAISCNS